MLTWDLQRLVVIQTSVGALVLSIVSRDHMMRFSFNIHQICKVEAIPENFSDHKSSKKTHAHSNYSHLGASCLSFLEVWCLLSDRLVVGWRNTSSMKMPSCFYYLILSLNQRCWHQKAKMPAQKASIAHLHTVSIRERRQQMTPTTIMWYKGSSK